MRIEINSNLYNNLKLKIVSFLDKNKSEEFLPLDIKDYYNAFSYFNIFKEDGDDCFINIIKEFLILNNEHNFYIAIITDWKEIRVDYPFFKYNVYVNSEEFKKEFLENVYLERVNENYLVFSDKTTWFIHFHDIINATQILFKGMNLLPIIKRCFNDDLFDSEDLFYSLKMGPFTQIAIENFLKTTYTRTFFK